MIEIARDAELQKLARLLQTEREAMNFLADRPLAELRQLRQGLTDALFREYRPAFAGFAKVSSRLPLGIAARIAQRVLGAVLSGRIAGEMPPERAVDMASRLSDEFLADICLHMEPQRAQPIIRSFPLERSVTVTSLLLERGEYITMGQFVDVLPRATLLAATDAIDSPLALLRIAFFVENSAQLETVIEHLSNTRRGELLQTAANEQLWPEVLNTLSLLDGNTRTELARQALTEDAAIVDSLIRAAAAQDLWPQLLSLGEALDEITEAQFAGQPAFAEPEIICSIADSVVRHNLWGLFEHQIVLMGEERAARMLRVCSRMRPSVLAAMAQHFALNAQTVETLTQAARQLTDDERQAAAEASGRDTVLGQLLSG
ncbi:MAG: hypothetical protein PF501_11285 [Salinisphaera sp.]|jgi:hypothetical protein|nr:hypothetical protein [Salinisphaera sp.]